MIRENLKFMNNIIWLSFQDQSTLFQIALVMKATIKHSLRIKNDETQPQIKKDQVYYKTQLRNDKIKLLQTIIKKNTPLTEPTKTACHSAHSLRPTKHQVNQQKKPSPEVTPFLQPELENESLFFKASLQYIRKKKIDNYYLFNDELIGQGSFAKVYKGINSLTNEIVAIKVMQMQYVQKNKLYPLLSAEIQIFKSLKHPNVLRCYDILITDNNCYIVTEMCDQGELKAYISKTQASIPKHSTQQQISPLELLIYDIYQGLLYLERKKIIHRDIKMNNILVKNGKAKIADFGLAYSSSQVFSDVRVGSPIYMAPESLMKNLYSPKTDVWAFGILLYEFFCGQTPFQHCRNSSQLEKEIIKPLNKEKLKNTSASPDAQKLIAVCLTQEWRKRPSFVQLWTQNYIKNLRFRSYVQSKKLTYYKEIPISNSNPNQSQEQKEIPASNRSEKKEDQKKTHLSFNKSQKQESPGCESGYSFEDFLKMSRQLHPTQTPNQTPKPQSTDRHGSKMIPKVVSKQRGQFIVAIHQESEKLYRKGEYMKKKQQLELLSQKTTTTIEHTSLAKVLSQKINYRQNQKLTPIEHLPSTKEKEKLPSFLPHIQHCLHSSPKINYYLPPQLSPSKGVPTVPSPPGDTSTQNTQASPSKKRKINLDKNYCQKFVYSQTNLVSSSSTNNILVETNCFLDSRNLFADCSQKTPNQSTLTEFSSSVEAVTNNQEILLPLIDPNVNSVSLQGNSVVSPVKNKKLENIRKQNILKFDELLKSRAQQLKSDQKQVERAKQNKWKGYQEKNVIISQQCWQIDLAFVLLEVSRFITKYLRFTDKLLNKISAEKVNNSFPETKTHDIWGNLMEKEMFGISQSVLIKKISQVIFTLDSQKKSELFQIIKSHKRLLLSIRKQHQSLITSNPDPEFTQTQAQQAFSEVYNKIKTIQHAISDFLKNSHHSHKQSRQTKRLCWVGLWLGRIYDAYTQVETFLFEDKKISTKQCCSISRDLVRSLESFLQSYQSASDSLQLESKSNNRNGGQVQKDKQNMADLSRKGEIENELNYLFQIIYEIQLKRMNSSAS